MNTIFFKKQQKSLPFQSPMQTDDADGEKKEEKAEEGGDDKEKKEPATKKSKKVIKSIDLPVIPNVAQLTPDEINLLQEKEVGLLDFYRLDL